LRSSSPPPPSRRRRAARAPSRCAPRVPSASSRPIGYPVESLITPRLIAIGLIAALFEDLELIFLFGVLE